MGQNQSKIIPSQHLSLQKRILRQRNQFLRQIFNFAEIFSLEKIAGIYLAPMPILNDLKENFSTSNLNQRIQNLEILLARTRKILIHLNLDARIMERKKQLRRM